MTTVKKLSINYGFKNFKSIVAKWPIGLQSPFVLFDNIAVFTLKTNGSWNGLIGMLQGNHYRNLLRISEHYLFLGTPPIY